MRLEALTLAAALLAAPSLQAQKAPLAPMPVPPAPPAVPTGKLAAAAAQPAAPAAPVASLGVLIETYVLGAAEAETARDWPRAIEYYRLALEEAQTSKNAVAELGVLTRMAKLFRGLNRLDEAEGLFRRSLDLAQKLAGTGSETVAVQLNEIAHLYLQKKEPRRAEVLFRRSLGLLEGQPKPDPEKVMAVLTNLSALFVNEKQDKVALAFQKRFLEVQESVVGAGKLPTAQTLVTMADTATRAALYPEAQAYLQGVLEILKPEVGEEHRDVGMILTSLANLQHLAGNDEEAGKTVAKALKILDVELPDHAQLARVLAVQGGIRKALGKLAQAEESYARSVKVLAAAGLTGTEIWQNYADVLAERGKPQEAEHYRKLATEALARAQGTVGN